MSVTFDVDPEFDDTRKRRNQGNAHCPCRYDGDRWHDGRIWH